MKGSGAAVTTTALAAGCCLTSSLLTSYRLRSVFRFRSQSEEAMISRFFALVQVFLLSLVSSTFGAFQASRPSLLSAAAASGGGTSSFNLVGTVSTAALQLASSTDIETMAEVKVGDKLPAVEMTELVSGEEKPKAIDLLEEIKGKKVAIFGVPGAFTPGCSRSHLPSFMDAQSDLKSKGVEMTICVATNDAYVMEAWGRTSGGSDAGIRFFADDAGKLTESAWPGQGNARGDTYHKVLADRRRRSRHPLL